MADEHLTRDWVLTLHKDGDSVQLFEYHWKARLVNLMYTVVDEIDHHVTRHLLCGQGWPEWAWKIPVGFRREYYDDDSGDMKNSIPSMFMDRYNRFLHWQDVHTRHEKVAEIPVTREVSAQLWPDMAWFHEEDETPEPKVSALGWPPDM